MMKKLLFAFLNLVVLNTVFGAEPTIAPSNLAIGTIQSIKLQSVGRAEMVDGVWLL
jgi:hypothetical protein